MAAQLNGHIVRAALALFEQQGVDRTTMDVIASAAKVSKRTLYGRFGSKHELILSAIELAFRDVIDPVVEEHLADGPVRTRLRNASLRLVEASLRPEISALANLIHWTNNNAPDLSVRAVELIDSGPTQLFHGILELAIERGEIVVHDLDYAAKFLADSLTRTPRMRLALSQNTADDLEDRCRYIDMALDVLLQGLTPREPS